MRFSKAKMLAELPTEALTNKDLDLVDTIVRRLQMEDGKVGVTLGDPYMGRQMALRLSPAQLEVPSSPESAAVFGIRGVPGQLESLADPVNAPRHMLGVDFGWVYEGDALGRMTYRQPRTKEGQRWAATQNYRGKLRAALPELMQQAGMGPGDLLYNNPIGTLNGDYRRAKTYMQSGFGAPTTENEQFARVDNMGRLVPVQPFGADQGLVRSMGWRTQAPISAANSPSKGTIITPPQPYSIA